jgi:hypothetical protein
MLPTTDPTFTSSTKPLPPWTTFLQTIPVRIGRGRKASRRANRANWRVFRRANRRAMTMICLPPMAPTKHHPQWTFNSFTNPPSLSMCSTLREPLCRNPDGSIVLPAMGNYLHKQSPQPTPFFNGQYSAGRPCESNVNATPNCNLNAAELYSTNTTPNPFRPSVGSTQPEDCRLPQSCVSFTPYLSNVSDTQLLCSKPKPPAPEPEPALAPHECFFRCKHSWAHKWLGSCCGFVEFFWKPQFRQKEEEMYRWGALCQGRNRGYGE